MARTALYRHFDADGRLLYVGITENLPSRDRQHRASPWHGKIAETKTQWFDSREDAARAEAQAITTERPLHNAVWRCEDNRQSLVKTVLAAIGRERVREALGLSTHSIRVAVNTGGFPASWYAMIREMCEAAGVECPMAAFNWRSKSEAA